MTFADELRAIAAEAAGDMGPLVALVALRRTENGAIGDATHPSRAFGVLSVPAPTYADQLHVAAISLRHHERRVGGLPVRAADGFYTPGFLQSFSDHWAPLHAANDPTHLNANHAKNLVTLAGDYAGAMRAAISRLG